MDGRRGLPEIVEQVRAAHPAQPVDVLERGARQLLSTGYVEDAAGPVPTGLTERDLRRYDRAVGYFRWLDLTPRPSSWQPQARLRDARVTILGVGGTGGIAALALTASGVGRLHCVDPDEVELSNLSRQILYTEDDIGKPKADAAVARLRQLNSDVEITGQRRRRPATATCWAWPGTVTCCCSPPTGRQNLRIWTNRACLAAGRPWVDAGYHGPLVQSGAFVPGHGPCWECTRLALRDSHAVDGADPEDSPPGGVARSQRGRRGVRRAFPAIWPPIWSSRCSPGYRRSTPGRIETVNLAALGAPLVLDDPPHPECTACGGGRMTEAAG